jgi:hypothetical protein
VKTILLILLLNVQPVRIVYYVNSGYDDGKAINELHAKRAVYDEDTSNAIVIQDQYDTLVIKYQMNELNEIAVYYPVIFELEPTK